MTKNKQNWVRTVLRKILSFLSYPLFNKPILGKVGDLPDGEKSISINQKFRDDLVQNAKEGKRWCEEAAMHWAEVLTVPFNHMIVTFDLGVLAFIGVMNESFFSQTILFVSITFALASLLILTIFTRSVIVKNINSLAGRVRTLNYTIILAPDEIKAEEDAKNTVELWKKQGQSLRENLNDLDDHVRLWMPWQKVGVYFFYASVFSVLIGITL